MLSEQLEFARGLATQGSCVIQLARFVEAARQTAVLEERNRLAREIHDSLAQTFSAIAMQLTVAEKELSGRKSNPLRKVRLAIKLAEVGLAEARRSALSLHSSLIEEAGLVRAVQMLVELSNLADRLRCNFRSNRIPEERLPVKIKHELFRITQEAMTNAIRHSKATLILVTLRWKAPNLILQIKDNGTGIPTTRLEESEGLGLRSIRERAAQIHAKLDIRTAPARGTAIAVAIPIS